MSLEDAHTGRRVLGLVKGRGSILLEHEWEEGRAWAKGYLRPGMLSPGAILISLHAGTHVLGDGLLFIHSLVHSIYTALALPLKKHALCCRQGHIAEDRGQHPGAENGPLLAVSKKDGTLGLQ